MSTNINSNFPPGNDAAEICCDELMPGVVCQSPKWRCLVQDHGWSDGKRTITWKSVAAPQHPGDEK